MSNIILPSEGCHWYLPDGSPYYKVPRADGKGDRDAHLGDARKVGAGPGVSSITGQVNKQQLNQFHEERIFDAAMNMEWKSGDDRTVLFKRARENSRAKGRAAAERGSELHGAISEYLTTGTCADKWVKHCEAVLQAMILSGFNVRDGFWSEHSFFHPLGYGGTVDYHSEQPKIGDFKTKDSIVPNKQYAYPEHAMQLAAYRVGLKMPPTTECWNFFIGVEDCMVLPHQWTQEELEIAWTKFRHLLHYWQADKQYWPGAPMEAMATPV